MASDSWLIVGLGNPGSRYADTRHNVGHLVVDEFVGNQGAALANHKGIADIATMRVGILPGGAPGPQVRVAKLRCYMNVSGGPVAQLMKFFDASPEHLLVIHDDLDLPEHTVKLKRGGGEGGHNGLKSISSALGTRDYSRLRLGIGRPPGRQAPADYVLGRLNGRTEWDVTFAQAADVLEEVVTIGFVKAQERLHSN